ncbi:MAG: beta-lactamase family protein [Candidatus Hydrogenedentes bacterium]|nr:beta-lactamase family protein [Candidatus Hydrogenedentota bacterium]
MGNSYITFANGYTDRSKSQTMSPTNSSMPVASISKLFTTLAILQLYEQNKLNFDTDVNKYLKGFKITSPFSRPITIHNLLTHTAGFDDKFLKMGAPSLNEVISLEKYLSENLPKIVYPPGYTVSYSNHGFALLGHLIENLSNLSFGDYVKKFIFDPLEMKNSSFDGSIPSGTIRPKGYYHILSAEREAYQDYALTQPASSLCTTAEDFSHFLLMLTNEGKYKGKQILNPTTIKMMFIPRYKFNPTLPGYSCAWEENHISGRRAFQHTGLTWGFSSLCLFIPEEKLGLFVCINSDKNALIWELTNILISRLSTPRKPISKLRVNRKEVAPEIYKQITGFYRFNRYCRNDIFRLATLFPSLSHEIYVKGDFEEKKLHIYPLEYGATPWALEEIGDFLWGKKSKSYQATPTMTITPAQNLGEWQVIFGNNAYEAITFVDSKPFKYALLFSSLTIFFLNLIKTVVKILKKIFAKSYRFSYNYAELLSILFIIYSAVFIFYLFLTINPQVLGYGIPFGLFTLIILSFVLLGITIVISIKCLIKSSPSFSENITSLLTISGCVAFLYLMYNTNILDLKLSFLKFLNLGYF